MYLLDQDYKYYSEPFPHIVIDNALPEDVASHMLKNFPKCGLFKKHATLGERSNWQHRGNHDSDPVFKQFAEINQKLKAKDFISTLDKIFNQKPDDIEVGDFIFRDQIPSNPKECIRDWHVDLISKKYHGMLYIGSGAGGELEMKSIHNDSEKSYAYQHNRFILWLNTKESLHRFFTSTSQFRKTISVPLRFIDNGATHEQ